MTVLPTARHGSVGHASNDTNQPQVLHTSTGKFTDKTCLMPGRGPPFAAAEGRRAGGAGATSKKLFVTFVCRSHICLQSYFIASAT